MQMCPEALRYQFHIIPRSCTDTAFAKHHDLKRVSRIKSERLEIEINQLFGMDESS